MQLELRIDASVIRDQHLPNVITAQVASLFNSLRNSYNLIHWSAQGGKDKLIWIAGRADLLPSLQLGV